MTPDGHPLRLFFPDGRELTVYHVRRDIVGSGHGDDGHTTYTRLLIEWDGHTGYVLERIGWPYRTWQPCDADGIRVYGQPWPHFDMAVMEMVTMIEEGRVSAV